MSKAIVIWAACVAVVPVIAVGVLAAATDNWFCGLLCGLSVPEALRWWH